MQKVPPRCRCLRTMQGLGAFAKADGPWAKVVDGALVHPSPGVRRAAIDCLPRDATSVKKIVATKLLNDKEPLVRKDVLFALWPKCHDPRTLPMTS